MGEGLVACAERLEGRRLGLELPGLQAPPALGVEEAQVRHHPLAVAVAVAALQVEEEADRADVGLAQTELGRFRLEGEIELEADRPAVAEGQRLIATFCAAARGRVAILRA